MAADHLQFLKNKFRDDLGEAVEEFEELPLRLHFEKILEVLQEKTISPSTPIVLKDPLYRLRFALAECVMLAEKEQEREAQNKKSRFNAYTVRKLWFLRKTRKRLCRIEAKLRETRDNATIMESSPWSTNLITVYKTPSRYRPEIYVFNDQLHKIEALLLETCDANSIKAIGIVGMGGVGKTTLAKEVFRRVESQFDLTFWVSLSEKLNLEIVDSGAIIIRKILEHLNGTAASDASQDDMLRTLHQKLLNRRYLIVLDGMWHVSDWCVHLNSTIQMDGAHNFGQGLPKGSGGAIIVTTRLEEVGRHMVGEHNLVRLQPTLDAESCWSIFMDSVVQKEYLSSDHVSTMKRMKEEIVDNCDGLPLAARTLAEFISIRIGKEEFWSDPTKEKYILLRLCVPDYQSLNEDSYYQSLFKAIEINSLTEGIGNKFLFLSVRRDGQVDVRIESIHDPEKNVKQIGKFGFTELISVSLGPRGTDEDEEEGDILQDILGGTDEEEVDIVVWRQQLPPQLLRQQLPPQLLRQQLPRLWRRRLRQQLPRLWRRRLRQQLRLRLRQRLQDIGGTDEEEGGIVVWRLPAARHTR